MKSVPHGGKLVNRINLALSHDLSLNDVELDDLELSDLELIANGGYSPLEGFRGKRIMTPSFKLCDCHLDFLGQSRLHCRSTNRKRWSLKGVKQSI